MFNQNTLRIIANGDFMPDQEYVKAMAQALLKSILIFPRRDGSVRNDGKPFWYEISKDGIIRGNIYHASLTNTFLVEIDGSRDSWKSFNNLESAGIYAKDYLKDC